jgi:hypothetical protein
MAKTPKRAGMKLVRLNLETEEGKLCLTLPLEVVISLAIDRIKIGAAQEGAETSELERLFHLNAPER